MKRCYALVVALATLGATPALADRPFGSSNQSPAVHYQY
jgi:hypothetical protein